MIVIGHRGARGLAPENTLASIRKALEHHVAEIEIDVHVTKDNVVVLNHDQTLTDPAGDSLNIADHRYEELKAHKADLATLAEAIESVRHKAILHIEVKPLVAVEPIVQVLQSYQAAGYPNDRFLLGSFHQGTLRQLHSALPQIEKVVIDPGLGMRAHRRARQVQTKRISLWEGSLYSWYIRMTQRSGYKLYAWTVNDPAKARKWAKAGLYGVITDYPDLFDT